MRKAACPDKNLLNGLLRMKRQYEKYFKTLEKPDNQAVTAYAGLIKCAAEIMRKAKPEPEEADPEEMKRLAEEIFESEYGIKRN